jgi:hypothetical protein
MKLKYYLDSKTKKKIYTLKSTVNNIPTNDAHYKFIKINPSQKSKFKS